MDHNETLVDDGTGYGFDCGLSFDEFALDPLLNRVFWNLEKDWHLCLKYWVVLSRWRSWPD